MKSEDEVKKCYEMWKKLYSKDMQKESSWDDPVILLIKTSINALEWVLDD